MPSEIGGCTPKGRANFFQDVMLYLRAIVKLMVIHYSTCPPHSNGRANALPKSKFLAASLPVLHTVLQLLSCKALKSYSTVNPWNRLTHIYIV